MSWMLFCKVSSSLHVASFKVSSIPRARVAQERDMSTNLRSTIAVSTGCTQNLNHQIKALSTSLNWRLKPSNKAQNPLGLQQILGAPTALKSRFCITGFYGIRTGFYGIRTGYVRVCKNRDITNLRDMYGKNPGFYGKIPGFYGIIMGYPAFLLGRGARKPTKSDKTEKNASAMHRTLQELISCVISSDFLGLHYSKPFLG